MTSLPHERWGTPFDDGELFELLVERDDPPIAILAAIDALEPTSVPAECTTRDKCRLFAIARLGERREAIPHDAESGLVWTPFGLSAAPQGALAAWCARALKALPRERALAVLDRFVAKIPSLRPMLEQMIA
jgi:hypothetical protein